MSEATMTRRTVGFIVTLALSLLVAPLAAAQPPAKVVRLGILAAGSYGPDRASNLDAFRQGLRDLGWVEGQNLALEYHDVEGNLEQLPVRAAELVQRQVEVIATLGGPAVTRAAKDATRTIPIVMVATADPVGYGFIASLARPGGNITGTASPHGETGQRRLELLMEAVPGVSRVAVLLNRASPAAVAQLHETQGAAPALGVELLILEPHHPDELEGAFAAMRQAGAGALLVLPDPFFLQRHLPTITALARQYRLPAMYPHRMYMDGGGFMYYGTSLREAYRRTAYYVDRILKGTKPADLPVEQPMKFELVINLKTAQTLGLTMPPSLLFQADEVIRWAVTPDAPATRFMCGDDSRIDQRQPMVSRAGVVDG
jgi:putative ABC transport system substrate-binding protein